MANFWQPQLSFFFFIVFLVILQCIISFFLSEAGLGWQSGICRRGKKLSTLFLTFILCFICLSFFFYLWPRVNYTVPFWLSAVFECNTRFAESLSNVQKQHSSPFVLAWRAVKNGLALKMEINHFHDIKYACFVHWNWKSSKLINGLNVFFFCPHILDIWVIINSYIMRTCIMILNSQCRLA